MSVQGIPAGGLKAVGQIVRTNDLRFSTAQNGLTIAVEILSSHISGAPVIDDEGRFVGAIHAYEWAPWECPGYSVMTLALLPDPWWRTTCTRFRVDASSRGGETHRRSPIAGVFVYRPWK